MKKADCCHLYFIISSQQLLALNVLVPRTPKKIDQYCFSFSKTPFKFSLPNCKICYYAMDSFRGYLAALWRFSIYIRKLRRKYRKCIIFLCHPWHIPTNYALFSLPHEEAYLIPDGLLNYRDTQMEGWRYRKMIIKVLLGFLTGLPYHSYRGHLTAYEKNKYNGVYTFNPNGLRTLSGSTYTLEIPTNLQPCSNKKSILILEQPIESLLSDEEVIILRRGLWNYIDNGNFDSILFKSHPSGYIQKPPSGLKKKVEIINSVMPVEMLIERLQVSEVISYCSSALITIADLYPTIQCIAVGFNLIAKKHKIDYLSELFKNRKVRMIDT